MPRLTLYQVDAFTRRALAGNPAAVVPIDGDWPDDAVLRAIADENHLSETAYFRAGGGGESDFELRWFTPRAEVALCGHATLATGHVLFAHRGWSSPEVRFATKSGILRVRRGEEAGSYTMDLPTATLEPEPITPALVEALGRRPSELYRSTKLLAVFDNKRDVHELRPDFRAVAALHPLGVVVTAPGAGHDFVSRFFAPAVGVDEDPVTGSSHCVLTPYWSKRLGKRTLSAHQVSWRGGEMLCTLSPDGRRTILTGHAVTFLEGTFALPE